MASDLPAPQFEHPSISHDMLGFFGARATHRNLGNLQNLDPSLDFYVRWTNASHQPEDLVALAHKVEQHLAQVALQGITIIPRAYSIHDHPTQPGMALYTFTPFVASVPLTHLYDSLSANQQVTHAYNRLGKQLAAYRKWAQYTGEIMYDIAAQNQYVANSPSNKQDTIVPQLVDVGAEFARFDDIKGRSYVACFDMQQHWLEHASALDDEQFTNKSVYDSGY